MTPPPKQIMASREISSSVGCTAAHAPFDAMITHVIICVSVCYDDILVHMPFKIRNFKFGKKFMNF